VSTGYELNGRIAQKRRTKEALVSAARDLVAQGVTPTVEAAAEAAMVSRTTAYRYFPSQRALLAAAHPETATETMLPDDPPSDVETRLDLVVKAVTKMIVDTEPQQRTMLRLSLEADAAERAALPLRQGRMIKWIEQALEPLQGEMSAAARHNLALAIRATIGIEALAWLTDVGGLSRRQATELMQWSAQALVAAARAGSPPLTRAR